MVESIIKETNLDPCVEQTTEDLGASGLFDLSRVRFSLTLFYSFVHSFANSCLDLKRWNLLGGANEALMYESVK